MSRPSPNAFFNNWARTDLTWAQKLRMSAKNTAIKVKNRSDCCGNHGEPGC